MQTTFDLPDALFYEIKADAARRGITLKAWFDEAVKWRLSSGVVVGSDKPWMRHIGKLDKSDARHLRNFITHADFSQIAREKRR